MCANQVNNSLISIINNIISSQLGQTAQLHIIGSEGRQRGGNISMSHIFLFFFSAQVKIDKKSRCLGNK